jgi:hypothetical protein
MMRRITEVEMSSREEKEYKKLLKINPIALGPN